MGQKHCVDAGCSKVKVFANSLAFHIEIPDKPITAGWLLAEARRVSNNPSLVGLRTQKRLEMVDAILASPDEQISENVKITNLEAVFQEFDHEYLSLEAYRPIKVIGNGGFCKVYMVVNRTDGKPYAMKVMNKAFIEEQGKTGQVLNELRILEQVEHPFIVKLFAAFQTVIEK
jgi:serine/threonine protein kinase